METVRDLFCLLALFCFLLKEKFCFSVFQLFRWFKLHLNHLIASCVANYNCPFGWSQKIDGLRKIKVFSMKEPLLPPYQFSFRRRGP